MAESAHRRLLLLPLLLLFSLSLSPVLCRNISPPVTGTTTSLDVAASVDLATRALSFDPRLAQQETGSADAGAASIGGATTTISLELHSRDFFPISSSAAAAVHEDYRALTLSRLRRDSARVHAINTRVSLAIHGVKRSDLLPLADETLELSAAGGQDGFSGPIVSGTSQGSGEYFSRVGIGSPARPMYMVLDTGSDVTWIQCSPCSDCYQQTDPIFDPSSSSSYSPVPCDSDTCRSLDLTACRNNSCLYQVSYGDGSFTVGEFATETLTFGDSSPVTGVAIGCGHDDEGLFVGSAGLLGLGGGNLSFPSQISTRSFSYCLVDRDSPSSSTLRFGSIDSPAAVTTPLLRNGKTDTFYYVGLSGISVGGAVLSIPPASFEMDESGGSGVIVDSGTAVTRLQTDVYASLRDAFAKGTKDLPAAEGVALFDTCYDLSSRTSVDVPTVAFQFPGGGELKLPAKNYLIPVDSRGTFCLAFAPTSSPLSIIGNVQQQGTRVTFDLDRSQVGFTPNQC